MRPVARRRIAVGAIALVSALVVVLAMPAKGLAQPTPTPGPVSSSQPSAGPATTPDQEKYRTYVFTATVDGSNLVAALAELRSCNGGRAACRHALSAASGSVSAFE